VLVCDVIDLSRRVDTVKEENLKLKSENLVLGQYIENLMEASAIFQSTVPQTKKSVVYLHSCHRFGQWENSIFFTKQI